MARVWMPEPRLVLLVEPVGTILNAFRDVLPGYGIDAIRSETFDDARELADRYSFDVAVLHVAPGAQRTIPFVSELSDTGLPVIVVSEMGSDADRIMTLERGADDYLVAPYNPHELLARVRAIVRRLASVRAAAGGGASPVVAIGEWSVDLAGRSATREGGEQVLLTAGEAQLLMVLVENAGRVLSREQLASRTHHDAADVFDRSVDVLIARLRRKLGDDPQRPRLIETIRGAGYRLIVAHRDAPYSEHARRSAANGD